MSTRRIDPTLYVQAADAFDAVATSADSVGSSARSSANGFASMAGEDPGGEQFASAYDDIAGNALQNIFDIGVRANSLDRLFMASGANAAAAEAAAAGEAFEAGSFTLRPARQPLNVAPPPSAFGGNAGEPEGWEIVTDFVGMMWPNADTDQLDQAAQAWKDIAGDVRRLATSVRQGDNAVAALDSAELARARNEVSEFATDIGQVADLIEDMGTQCSEYADDVREAHKEVIEMLVQLAIEIAATVAISAALSAFTFGASAAVGAGAMAARIAMIGGRIVTILTRVGGTAARVAVRIRAIRASLIPFATRFQRPVQAAINIASGTAAAVTSEAIVKGGEGNYLAAIGSGLIGGSVTEAIVAPFGKYGQRVIVQALAGGGGGAVSGAADGLISDGSVDIRQVVISGVGGAAFSGWGARGGRGGQTPSGADPGAGNVHVDDAVPVITGGNSADSAGPDGGRTGSNDYEGPVVSGGNDVSSTGSDGGSVGNTNYDGPQVTGGNDVTSTGPDGGSVGNTNYDGPQVTGGNDVSTGGPGGGSNTTDVPTPPPVHTGGNDTPTPPVHTGGSDTPTPPVHTGGNDTSPTGADDTPLFHDTETELGVDVDGDGHVGAPPTGTEPSTTNTPDTPEDTPIFHDTEADTGIDADGDGVAGDPADAATDADPAPTGADPDGAADSSDGGSADSPSAPLGEPGSPVNYDAGVRFFGPDQLDHYLGNNATLGPPSGGAVFLMPEADAVNVHDSLSAAIESGMAPSAMNAWRNGEDVYGALVPMDGIPQRLPTPADANGWPHFVPGGYTAVNVGGEFFLNPTREFVIDGGIPMPRGTIIFRLLDGGNWEVLAIHG